MAKFLDLIENAILVVKHIVPVFEQRLTLYHWTQKSNKDNHL